MAGQKQARGGSGQARGAVPASSGAVSRPGKPGRQAPQPSQSGPSAGKVRPGPAVQDSRPATAESQPLAPRWLQLTTLILSVFGLGVSVYLTIAHYTTSAVLACSDKGFVNCAKVTTSAESVVLGIFPVAVLGLAFYV